PDIAPHRAQDARWGPRSAVVAPLRRGPHGADCAPWGGTSGRLAALGATLDFHHGLLTPLAAHHVISAKFDSAKQVTLRGPIAAVDWANPHAHVFINVADGNGRIANWAIELESPVDLRRQGWTANTVSIGDVVTVEGIAARDGSKQAWSLSMVLARTGQRVFFARPVAPPAATHKPTPRWPDRQPRLSALPGDTGYWASPSATTLVERGVTVEADANGLLTKVADAPRVAPFQTWARDLYMYRQRALLKDDPMFINCLPPGGPRQFMNRYGLQFLEQRDRQRVFVMMGGGNRNWRLIYTDAREQPGQQPLAAGDGRRGRFGVAPAENRAVTRWLCAVAFVVSRAAASA